MVGQMAGRRELERQLHVLGDIGAILGVMKNLALMEAGKLSRILGAQREMVASLESAAADFLTWFPQPEADADKVLAVLLLVGSQRGFCGDFNDLLLASLSLAEEGRPNPLRIAIGAKLSGRLRTDFNLDGPYAVEEIGQVIHELMKTLDSLLVKADGGQPLQLAALFHDPDSGGVAVRPLAPFALQTERTDSSPAFPPQLNISPPTFFAQLAEQHLLAAITEMFHCSLMAESRFRLNHIEGASNRMEKRAAELKRQQTLARQEEIIEEIEAILAGAGLDKEDTAGVEPVSTAERSC